MEVCMGGDQIKSFVHDILEPVARLANDVFDRHVDIVEKHECGTRRPHALTQHLLGRHAGHGSLDEHHLLLQDKTEEREKKLTIFIYIYTYIYI